MKLKLCGLQIGGFEKGDTVESYLEKHVALLRRAVKEESEKEGGKPYVCVYPEAMTYGYFGGVVDDQWFQLAENAQQGPTTTRMTAEAKELGVHIVYSFFEKAMEYGVAHYYNACALVSPTRGLIGVYRKCHIPSINLEDTQVHETYYFEPGKQLSVFEMDNGVPVGMLICYDRSFPVAWNALYLQGAKLIFVPICTWGFRSTMFQPELQIRAFETHTFVVGMNRSGNEQMEGEKNMRPHFGKSIIAGPMGANLASLEDEKWAYMAAIADLEEIDKAHFLMNFKRDRRPEIYGVVAAPGNFNGPYVHTHNKF